MSKQDRENYRERRAPRSRAGETFWEGVRCRARVVRVRVGRVARSSWWCAKLEGQVREAVEVTLANGHRIYIDNVNGEGWAKVTKGMGLRSWPSKSYPVSEVIEEVLA